jgi:hypothetical protein
VKLSRGRKIAILSAAAGLSVLAAAAGTQWAVVVEEWYLYCWRRGGAAEKEVCFRTLVKLGSVRALRCLEAEDVLYLIDVGGRGTARRIGARAYQEVRRHLGTLSENQRFAIVWMGNGVSVFPPLEPGTASPQPAKATGEAKRQARCFLGDQWAAGPRAEEPCIRWALLTARAVATPTTSSKEPTVCYFGSGPASANCRYCPGHRAPDMFDTDTARRQGTNSTKPRIFCFVVPAADSAEGADYLKDLASRTGGVYLVLRN